MSEFAVIGLGRFGRAVVRNLVLEGQDVLAIDRNPERLELVGQEADATLCIDTTEEQSLAALPLERMTTVVVTIGSRAMEASLLTVALLDELEVPRIVARAFDERHARLLRKLGAHEVLDPEDAMGRRLALRLADPGIGERITLGESAVAEVELPETFVGSSLSELALEGSYGVEVLALCRGNSTLLDPDTSERIESGDRAILMGAAQALKQIAALA